jgi:hypothetical protein
MRLYSRVRKAHQGTWEPLIGNRLKDSVHGGQTIAQKLPKYLYSAERDKAQTIVLNKATWIQH